MASWRNLTYHDVRDADDDADDDAGDAVHSYGAVTPAVLEAHLALACAEHEVVGPDEAVRRIDEGDDAPLVTFWFDDGLRGVLRHALPLFQSRNKRAAVAVCSAHYRRDDAFWRVKLARVVARGGGARLRARLALSCDDDALPRATLDAFTLDVADGIDEVWRAMVPDAVRAADVDRAMGIAALRTLRASFTIANHTAHHYPVGEPGARALLRAELEECERALVDDFGSASDFWVLPFARKSSQDVVKAMRAAAGDRFVVLMGDRRTTRDDVDQRIIYRYQAPLTKDAGALRALLHLR